MEKRQRGSIAQVKGLIGWNFSSENIRIRQFHNRGSVAGLWTMRIGMDVGAVVTRGGRGVKKESLIFFFAISYKKKTNQKFIQRAN